MLNWIKILEQHKISYRQGSGENLEVPCVWCGASDPSMHLSISTVGKGYRCWRNTSHRGRNPIRLLMALLKCTKAEAATIAGMRDYGNVHESGTYDVVRSTLRRRIDDRYVVKTINLPDHFKPIINKGGTRLAFNYLMSRGYSEQEVEDITRTYGLIHTISGVLTYRIVFPVRFNYGPVNYTARAISETLKPRYRTLTTDIEKSRALDLPVAAVSIEQTLWNYDSIAQGGKKLFIAEGPFDAMRLDYFGREYDIHATCLFGKNISDYQISLLDRIRDYYDDIILVIDRDARLNSLELSGRLAHLNCRFMKLPPQIADPAELSRNQARTLFLA